MKRFLSLLFAGLILVSVTTSCLSESERALKNSVNEYASTLPSQVAPGVVIESIVYSTDNATVTLTCRIENDMIAYTVKNGIAVVKTMFIPYLKSQNTNQIVHDLIAAGASLECVFTNGTDTLGSFVIDPSEL